MTNNKIALMAIPILSAIMVAAAITPSFAVPASIEIDIKPQKIVFEIE